MFDFCIATSGFAGLTFFYFNSVLRPFQDYFSSYETKTVGENGRTSRKTTWYTRKQNLACLTCGQCAEFFIYTR